MEYVTTPIFYVNDKPHIGHAYTLIIADIIARIKHFKYLTGTDEHGSKILSASYKQSIPVQELCDQTSMKFRSLADKLNIKYDYFVRTTNDRHKTIVKKIYNTLYANNMIYKGIYTGWYAESDECFYKEKDLINGKAPTHSEVKYISEECYFFKLSKMEKQIIEYIENANIIPNNRKIETLNYAKKGLYDLAISRNTEWGIKLDEKNTIYVWIDALCSYLDMCFDENVNDQALSQKEIEKINQYNIMHIIGKDILNFHTIYWPAILIACNIIPPKNIIVHGWFLSDNKKMSKSIGNVIDPIKIIEKYGYETLRFALLKEPKLGEDGDISEDKIKQCLNQDLVNNIGNLFHRSLSMMHKINIVQDDMLISIPDIQFSLDCSVYIGQILAFTSQCNKLINDYEPWKKTDNNILFYTLYQSLIYIAQLLEPILPDASLEMTKQINQYKINKPYPIFKKVE